MLAPEKVKEFLIHPDVELRHVAMYYLSRHYDRSVVHAEDIWSAIDRIGAENPSRMIVLLDKFEQSDDSMRRLIEFARQHTGELFDDAAETLVNMPLDHLERHAEAILALPVWEPTRKDIETQLEIARLPPDEIWKSLETICENTADDEDSLFFTRAMFLVKALARHGDAYRNTALEILQRRSDGWLEIFCIHFLGRIRAAEAIDPILQRLDLYDGVQIEAAVMALINIGDAQVVTAIATKLGSGNWDFQYAAAEILSAYPTPESQKLLFDFVSNPENEDSEVFSFAQMELIHQIPTEEPVLNFLCKVSMDAMRPVYDSLDGDLLILSKLIGIEFSEADIWRRRVERQKLKGLSGMLNQRMDWEENHPEEFPMPAARPVLQKKLIGRNDPCPCGSGKKYKKCCLDKLSAP